MQPILISCLE